MRSYVILLNWTDQGVRNIRDTIKRARAFRALTRSREGKVREHLYTLGEYDIVMGSEAGLGDNCHVARGIGRGRPDTQMRNAFPGQAPRRVPPEGLVSHQLAERRQVARGRQASELPSLSPSLATLLYRTLPGRQMPASPPGRSSTLPAMSVDLSAEITAIATAALAVFAIVTAFYARQAFRRQSQEVSAIGRQVKDQQELTRQQAELLKVQSGQLELQRQQLDDQRKANADQAKVLKLQADELRESLAARQRAAEQQRKAQASKVFIVESEGVSHPPGGPPAVPFVVARAVNSSDQPVYDVEFYWRRGSASHGEPNPEPLGILMPGEREEKSRDFPGDTNMAVSGAILRFRDAAGVKWIRRPDGRLVERQ